MDALLRLERPTWSWKDLGSVILIACFTATALLLTVIGDLVLRRAAPEAEPGREAIRIESHSASRSES